MSVELKWMQTFLPQLLRRAPFQVPDDLLELSRVRRNDQVHMIGKDRARVDEIFALVCRPGEAARDGPSLNAGEIDRLVFEGSLGGLPQFCVMGDAGDGSPGGDFCRAAETEQFPRPDEIAP